MSLATRLQALSEMGAKDPRILTLDIETSPATLLAFSLDPGYISPDNVVEPSRVLCFAAKWHGSKAVEWHSEQDGRQRMVEAAWRLLDEADIVVGYNHRRFDIPHLQREMVQAGYGPPSPWIDVDLLPVMRSRFKFLSNRLGYVVDQLGLDAKADAGGFDTWRRVMAGDPKAWARMRRYNVQDVQITEELFDYLRPWLRNLPHLGLFTGRMRACAACGSDRLAPDGVVRTRATAWLRMACAACGAHNRLMASGETRPA